MKVGDASYNKYISVLAFGRDLFLFHSVCVSRLFVELKPFFFLNSC